MTLTKQLLLGFVIFNLFAWFAVTLLKALMIDSGSFCIFTMILFDSAEATTDGVCTFYCFS